MLRIAPVEMTKGRVLRIAPVEMTRIPFYNKRAAVSQVTSNPVGDDVKRLGARG